MEKKEKKVYEQPRMEAVEVKMQGHILDVSQGGGGGNEMNPSRDDDPLGF